ncbi:MAG: GntR family transcriptional regulator [Candidatus Pacebacteria bacterium]|nr:GntR family transcriptional regulator [Candidatus Paceibacterota bacterium]
MARFGAQQIARDLATGIYRGDRADGDLLPTRIDLVKQYGVARATVDRAIQLLVQKGLVETRQGSGTRVHRRSLRHRILVIGDGLAPEGLPMHPRTRVTVSSTSDWDSASRRVRLKEFDGLIWYLPTDDRLEWVRELRDQVPQVVINRTPDDLDYISTDHAGAIAALTAERLKARPDALPVFLACMPSRMNHVLTLRKNGFVTACREKRTFYEVLDMPDDFTAKKRRLQERFDGGRREPLLIVSAALQHTGAVLAWVHASGRSWGRDVMYSDFDNDLPRYIWGVTVTSFIQNYNSMLKEALNHLVARIDGAADKIQILRAPLRREGET